MKKRGLIDRLNQGPVICAEGFLFEIEKRGYMSSGEFVPMVSLEHPEALENLHRDFQHAGSDIVQAFTYNGHREKMRVIGKEELLEPLNRAALKIAKKIADNPIDDGEPNLMSGNISNSNIWEENEKATHLEVERMFTEMVGWAVDEGADLIMGETFYYAEEAYKALDIMKQSGLPAVVNIAPMGENIMRDGVSVVEQKGSEHRDEMTKAGFLSNHSGGVLGGISSGQNLLATISLKPTSSITVPGQSLDQEGNEVSVVTKGRHDPCVGIRATPIAEAMMAIVLMDHYLRFRGQTGFSK